MERTLSIIKPDGVKRQLKGAIISRFVNEGLDVVAAKMKVLSHHEAKGFYAEHKERPFFADLVEYMCSGPVLLMVLEGEGAVKKNRAIMGATNPQQAEENTLRKLFGQSIGENTVHGSDSLESANREIAWFFAGSEIVR